MISVLLSGIFCFLFCIAWSSGIWHEQWSMHLGNDAWGTQRMLRRTWGVVVYDWIES